MIEQAWLPGTQNLAWPAPRVVRTRAGDRYRYIPELVLTEKQLRQVEAKAGSADTIAFDTETSGLKPHFGARIVGHCLAAKTDADEIRAWYIPIRHVGAHNEEITQLPADEVSSVMREVLRRGSCITHHGKFDRAMARADDIPITRDVQDVAVLATIANENERAYALKALTAKYVFEEAKVEKDRLDDWMRKDARSLGLRFKKRAHDADVADDPTYLERFGYARTPIYDCGAYGCKDALYTLCCGDFYAWVWEHFREVACREHLVADILHEMEWNGLPADVDEIHRAYEAAERELQYWLGQCASLSGRTEFSLSPPALKKLFYSDLGFEPVKETKKGQPSVDREARRLLMRRYPPHAPLLEAIDKASGAEKLRSTYTGAFLRYYAHGTQSIHPSYNQMERKEEGGVPVTGRLSSADPNIQNIASRPLMLHDGGTISIRRYFTVPKGFIRAYIDFSQIELRVLAWFSRDPKLLYCYANDLDVHQMTADSVTAGDRRTAKQVNFGNSYGMTEIGLAKRMTGYFDNPASTQLRAKQVLIDYFREYAGIPEFKRSFATQMRANGNAFTNPFGRPRRIEDISAWERWKRERAERQMMSSIISGTAADIMKESMIRCYDHLRENAPTSRMVQTIHDELVFDLRLEDGWAVLLGELIQLMEDWPQFENAGVPIRTSCDLTFTTWEEKKAIKMHPGGAFEWLSD